MLSSYRRGSRAGAVTPYRGRVVAGAAMRTARTLVDAARKLAPYARAAGAKSTVQRKLGPFKMKKKVSYKPSAKLSYETPGNDLTVSKHTVGRKASTNVYALKKLIENSMQKRVYRWQAITQYDTNQGALNLAPYTLTGPQFEIGMPFHVYDLTSFPNVNASAPALRFAWQGNSGLPTDTINRRVITTNTDATGSPTLTGNWVVENSGSDGATGYPNAKSFRHDWTDIRMNLYGARKRTTRFEIMFVRIKDEFANFSAAAVTNNTFKELLQYIERPCIYSNLQSLTAGGVSKKMQVVKKFTYFVPGGQTTDVDTSVGKIQEVRIFMRQNKIYSTDWRDETILGHTVEDGQDFVSDVTHNNGPFYGSRLYMIVRAFCPERGTAVQWPVTPNVLTDPTYDILLRNSVSIAA